MSEVKLLPMGGTLMCRFVSMGMDEHAEAVEAYARANMEPLLAEMEALKSDLSDYMRAANYEANRAERLAEALRDALTQNEHDMVLTGDEIRKCRAALDQEDDDA